MSGFDINRPVALNIDILYHDQHFLVVNKPPGIAMHDSDGERNGLLSMLKRQLQTAVLFPVHRLDKVTSGCVLVAKTAAANRELSQLFAKKQVQKFYLAVVSGSIKKKQGAVVGDMTTARNGCWKLLHSKDNPAVTQFFSVGLGGKQRLCLIKPLTGKTHQIRVAMKSLAAPIVGDTRYGGESADRVYLHAYAIAFEFHQQVYRFMVAPDTGAVFLCDTSLQQLQVWSCPHDLAWPKR